MTEGMTHVSCNLCGSDYTDLLYLIDGLRVVQCRVCDLVYLNPRAEEVAARNRTRDLVAHFAPLARRQRIDFERRLRRILRIAGRPGRLLDVGCGAGGFMEVAREGGWSVVGVDVNGPATAHARESLGLDVVTGTIEEVPEEYGVFDVVSLWDVAERVPDPKGLIAQARERLENGGLIALSVPNVGSLAAWRGRERWPMFGDEHLTYFAPETIRKMVALAGFKVVRVETQGLGQAAGQVEEACAEPSHWPGALFVERIVNAVLDLFKAGQVVYVYARKRSGSNAQSSPSPPPPFSPNIRRGRRRRTSRGLGM